MPVIMSRYPGRCRNCRKPYSKGDSIYWVRGFKGALCMTCHSGNSSEARQERTSTKTDAKLQTASDLESTKNRVNWSIDWLELRDKLLSGLKGNDICLRAENNRHMRQNLAGSDWKGYDSETLERWLRSGYQPSQLTLGDPPVPIREKRRLIFRDEGDEFHYDLAMSGIDNCFSEWTKQETIPGLAIEAEIMFSASVNAEVVNAYSAWICRAVYSLEENGVDCQVSLKFTSAQLFNDSRDVSTIVRVKKENEITDFISWSAMISPASLRSFGFAAMTLNADAHGKDVSTTMGRGNRSSHNWNVSFDLERRVMLIQCPYSGGGYSFPEEDMTDKLHAALKETRKATA